jgi:hypothetical protein
MSDFVTTAVAHDKEMAREFLAALDPNATKFTFQFFGDAPGKHLAKFVHGTLDEFWPEIERVNTAEHGIGVFVTVNETDGKGRSRKNMVQARALMVDADNDEQVARCEETFANRGVTPNIVVKTGRGKHYYFIADDVALDEYTNLQQGLIERLGTDKAVKDVTRVMRLAGTYHLKNPDDPRLVTLERANRYPHWTKGGLAIALGFGFAAHSSLNPVQATPSHKNNNTSVEIGDFSDPSYHTWTREHFGHLTERLSDGLDADVEEIRSAALAIPPSALASEHDWVRVARGIAREAAIFPTSDEKLWGVLDEISRRAPRYDEEENRRRWLRYKDEAFDREKPITIATVFDLATKHGWSGHISPPPSAMPQGAASRAVPVSSLPLVPPKRKWLHGTDLIRGAVTVLYAPGGRAKSTWLLTCALACGSGRQLLGSHIFGGPLRVLCLSTEDGISEMTLRIRAAQKHHGLTDADVPGLFVIGADRWGLPLLQADGSRATLDSRGLEALIAELDQINPDVLIIDPLINLMGGVSSNDNAAAALLMGHLARLASTRNIAIALAHHASKGRDLTSADSAMGAASYINLARVALAIDPLEENKAGGIGVPSWEAKFYFRVIGTKQNFAPPSTHDRWFRTVSVDMHNPEPPVYAEGEPPPN